MVLLGNAHCESYLEVEHLVTLLKDIGLEPRVNGLKVMVEYAPSKDIPNETKDGMISTIAEIMEPIRCHGISIVSERGDKSV